MTVDRTHLTESRALARDAALRPPQPPDGGRGDGRALCAELLPELIRLDDWGYPILATGPVPEHLLAIAERAVEDCPVLALALRRAPRSP